MASESSYGRISTEALGRETGKRKAPTFVDYKGKSTYAPCRVDIVSTATTCQIRGCFLQGKRNLVIGGSPTT